MVSAPAATHTSPLFEERRDVELDRDGVTDAATLGSWTAGSRRGEVKSVTGHAQSAACADDESGASRSI